MPVEVVSILVLVLVFLIATFTSAHMGALALVATFVIATIYVGGTPDEVAEKVFGGFPGDLFVILVGVTYLFALAKNNGTVDWLVQAAVRAVGGRVAFIPWVMFLVTGVLTAAGAVVPAAVAIIAPMGMGFAARYRINPVLMGLLIINGASAGGFSPISIFGGITNNVVARSGLEGSPAILFAASFFFNLLLSVVVFFMFGGRSLIGRRDNDTGDSDGDASTADGTSGNGRTKRAERLDTQSGGAFVAGPRQGSPVSTKPTDDATGGSVPVVGTVLDRTMTVVGIAVLAIGALVFDLDVGLMAVSVAVVLTLVSPKSSKGAINQIAWPTVLLICGIVTYVSLMEDMGTIEFLGDEVASIGVPLLAALLICLIGAAVSAFASTTGILGALIPLAVPFLLAGEVGAIGLITALALSSSVVDSSPFSTSGALVVANASEAERDRVFSLLMRWGMSMILVIPLVTWAVFVLPGWL
ncbi:UIT1 family transporter [Murinocardiopsis flavida]|uniref:UIT1 family transporter n=1 Tax=Murinocardiopsis flavida TaxID=645275 RepID=A0A2P8DPD6_9ACTN|nr:SLC13 family permease [Murinocardiopsis flavida]PSK99084.1 UIT1 family transporter [Murinocardiopsis flavida]